MDRGSVASGQELGGQSTGAQLQEPPAYHWASKHIYHSAHGDSFIITRTTSPTTNSSSAGYKHLQNTNTALGSLPRLLLNLHQLHELGTLDGLHVD